MREILHRLFNEDDLRLFEPSPVYFRCRCSRERVAGMLQGLGEAETRVGARRARRGRSALRFLQPRLCVRRGGCRADCSIRRCRRQRQLRPLAATDRMHLSATARVAAASNFVEQW